MTEWEDVGVRWTVRVALALYVAALLIRAFGNGRPSWLAAARGAWTIAYVAFLMHLVAAFQFVHSWSHEAAYEATARQTDAVAGIDWGGGVYANYVFALIWGLDVLWWWMWPRAYVGRPRWIEWSVQAFLAFIAFNSTVVFGRGAIRWIGAGACLALLAASAAARRRRAFEATPN